jgi:hypothetical protein
MGYVCCDGALFLSSAAILLFANQPTPETAAPRHLTCAHVAPVDTHLEDTAPEKSPHSRELFFSDQAKANTLTNYRALNCDSEKRSFYRCRAPLRFYTA